VALREHDDVVEHLPSKTADEPLGVSVLPWRPGRALDLLDAGMAHAGIEVTAARTAI
jgi:hypothetical protein